MRRPPKTKSLGQPISPTRDPRCSSMLNARGGARSGSGKTGVEKCRDSASSAKSPPASAGAAPSLTLSVLAVPGTTKPAPSPLDNDGGRKVKPKSPSKKRGADSKRPIPHPTTLMPAPFTAISDDALTSNARVTFLEKSGGDVVAPTPRKAGGKGKRAPPATLDAIKGASKTGPPVMVSSPPAPTASKLVDDAPVLQLSGRTMPMQRVPTTMAPLTCPPTSQTVYNASESNGPSVSSNKTGTSISMLSNPLPPLSGGGASLGVSTSSFASGQGTSSASPVTFAVSAGCSLASGNTSLGKRPMTLLERRSARERNAMSISCLSTLSVETIQESSRDLAPVDTMSATPILRGWSRTVANVQKTENIYSYGNAPNSPPSSYGNAEGNGASLSATATSGGALTHTESAGMVPLSPEHAVKPELLGAGAASSTLVRRNMQESSTPMMLRSAFARMCSCPGAIKLISYNILADRLVTTDRYPSCPPLALGEDYRTQLMKKELQHMQADILVFAEMSVDMFEKPNLLGGFLRNSMTYNGDHVVITDQFGKPLCRPCVPVPSPNRAGPPLRRSTVAAVPVLSAALTPGSGSSGANTAAGTTNTSKIPFPPSSPPTQQHLSRPSSCVGSNTSMKRDSVLAISPSSGNAASAVSESGLDTPRSSKVSGIVQAETPSRRTEMEGVAVFYNRNRFDLLERVPVRFNEVAMSDTRLTPMERKKLQARSHNVALISVLRDRMFPTHVYLVSAVHIIWQRVEAQLWQSRVLMQIMEELKCKYDMQWREGKRQRPVGPATTPAKGAKHEISDYVLPAVFKRDDKATAGGDPAFALKMERLDDEEEEGTPSNARAPSHTPLAGRGAEASEQHAICIVAGDFNAERTNPTLRYICDGYVPAQAPVMSYWHSGVGDFPLAPGQMDMFNIAEDEETEANEDSLRNAGLGASVSTVVTPTAARRCSTHTLCGEEVRSNATSSPGRSRKGSFAYAFSSQGGESGASCTQDGGGSNLWNRLANPLHLATCTPQTNQDSLRRQLTAPIQRSGPGDSTSEPALWLSADRGFPKPHEMGKYESAVDELGVSPVKKSFSTPVHDKWCGEDGKGPFTGNAERRVSLLDGSGSETHGGGAGFLSTLMMSGYPEIDTDLDAPPPPPAARRKKKNQTAVAAATARRHNDDNSQDSPVSMKEASSCKPDRQPPQKSAMGQGAFLSPRPFHVEEAGGLSEVTNANPWVPSALPSSLSPAPLSKVATARRRKVPGLLATDVSAQSGHLASDATSRLGRSNQSTIISEGGSSVLSNALEVDHPTEMPRNSLFTPESLRSSFNEATRGGNETGAPLANTEPGYEEEEEEVASADIGGGDCDDDTTPTSTASLHSRPSLNEDGDSMVPALYKFPDNRDKNSYIGAQDSGSPPAGGTASLSGMQDRMDTHGLVLPSLLSAFAPGVTHELRLVNAYEAYCRSHPKRVSAVNPSSNQEGKVLDHILYEPAHVACASVLRLGEFMELPTRNVPSDHYMIGALLVPRASLDPLSVQGPSPE